MSAQDWALLVVGTAMLPLWLAGFVAHLVYEGVVIGWALAEVFLKWLRSESKGDKGNEKGAH